MPQNRTSHHITASNAEIADALDEANLPTLLMVLATLTGEDRWLSEEFRPSRTVALEDNDDGGFDEPTQQTIRSSALEVLTGIRDGQSPVPPPPDSALVPDLLSHALNEPVDPDYAEMLADQAGFRSRLDLAWTDGRPDRADSELVVVIGAGLAGIAAARMLHRLHIPFTVLERREEAGGVWVDNHYPGAGVDTPSHLYSYSFAQNPGWTRFYAKQREIKQYIQDTVVDLGLLPHIRFGTEVASMEWDEESQNWRVHARSVGDGGKAEEFRAVSVISCVGILNEPKVPELPGISHFDGPVFHSSHWPDGLDIDGKRFAVIGTGATGMQLVPALAARGAHVSVFQRSAQWFVPNGNYSREVSPGRRWLMENVPYYAALYRIRLSWLAQDKLLPSLYKDPEWPDPQRSINRKNDKTRQYLTNYMVGQLADRTDLVDKVIPDYPPYGKRMLMDNGWITAIKRENVDLVTSAISGFDGSAILTDNGDRIPADHIVLASGFHSARMLSSYTVIGRDGLNLQDVWDDDNPYAYLGITVPGFPNLFIVGGPNSNIGHGGSAIFPCECALGYVGQLLIHLLESDLGSIEVDDAVCQDYNRRLDAEHEKLIWTHPGMTTWYRNSRGRVTATTPWRGLDYWTMTQRPDLTDFIQRPRPIARAAAGQSTHDTKETP